MTCTQSSCEQSKCAVLFCTSVTFGMMVVEPMIACTDTPSEIPFRNQGTMRRKLTILLAACVVFPCAFFVLSQGTAIIPNYDDHPFHDVYVDYVADDELKGWRIFEDTENVDRLTRLGFALAIAKFPDVRSCLKNPDEPLSATSELDWDRIKRPKQAGVCVFNIAHAFADKEMFERWVLIRYEKIKNPDFSS